MAKKSSSLTSIGRILVLIDGILIIVFAILGLLNQTIDLGIPTGTGAGAGFLGDVIGAIIAIVIGLLFIFIYTEKISVGEGLVLGIVVLVLGILFGTWLSVLGGILIIIDQFV